jgi:hypothetical protein
MCSQRKSCSNLCHISTTYQNVARFRTISSEPEQLPLCLGYSLHDRVIGVRFPIGTCIFPLSASRWKPGLAQPLVQRVPVVLYPNVIP